MRLAQMIGKEHVTQRFVIVVSDVSTIDILGFYVSSDHRNLLSQFVFSGKVKPVQSRIDVLTEFF